MGSSFNDSCIIGINTARCCVYAACEMQCFFDHVAGKVDHHFDEEPMIISEHQVNITVKPVYESAI